MSTSSIRTNTPRLSIVMPFFNHKEMVAEMIDSIVANDYQDWELLAINDGSTQETIDYLEHYKKDERIQIIKRNREPKGAQTCRNIGLEMACGEYIVFFDSDDYIAPYCLRNRVEQLDAHPNLDFMVFPSGTYNNSIFKVQDSHDIYGYPIFKDDLTAFIKRTLPFIVWNNIYRLDSLRKKNLNWDIHLLSLQDSDFNIQALLHGLKYDYAPSLPDYGYRTEANSTSVSKKIASELHRQSHLYFVRKQYQEIQQVYENNYNLALYQGVLYLFSSILAGGLEYSFARNLTKIVSQHDKYRGSILHWKIELCIFLERFLPPKISRQLPMLIFLIRKRLMERVIIPHRIAKRIKTTSI